MGGWLDGWMDGWVGFGWVYEWMGKWVDGYAASLLSYTKNISMYNVI